MAAATVCLFGPTMAFAAEHGEGGPPPSLFAGDLGNTIWTLVIFVVLLLVLGKFAWKPILATLQRREQFIRESLEEAKQDREKAEQRLREYEEKLQKAHQEAAAIVEEGRRDAEDTRKRIQEQSRSEAEAMIERARREIGIAKDGAVKDLYQLVANMATDVTAKVLRRDLTDEEQKRLVNDATAEIRNTHGTN